MIRPFSVDRLNQLMDDFIAEFGDRPLADFKAYLRAHMTSEERAFSEEFRNALNVMKNDNEAEYKVQSLEDGTPVISRSDKKGRN